MVELEFVFQDIDGRISVQPGPAEGPISNRADSSADFLYGFLDAQAGKASHWASCSNR